MTRNLTLILITAVCLTSCKRDKDTTVITQSSFEKVFSIESEVIDIYNNKYDGVLFADTILIGFRGATTTNFVDLYTLSKEPLASICWQGRGPNEFLNLALNPYSGFTENGEIKIWGFDHAQNTAFLFNLSKSITNQATIIDEKVEFPSSTISFIDINQNKIIGLEDMAENGNILIYEIDQKSFTDSYVPYKQKFVAGDYSAGYITNNFIDGNKFIINFSTMNRVDIVDIDTREIDSYSLYTKPTPIREVDFDNPVRTYKTVFTTNDYIIGLYMNETMQQLMRAPSTPKEIHIYDRDFKPLARVHINEHPIILTFDEHNKYMYGTSSEDHIFRFDMKEILNNL